MRHQHVHGWLIAAAFTISIGGRAVPTPAQCESATLLPADGALGDQFGSSCDAGGDRIIVGSPVHNAFIGAAYVFLRMPGGWVQEAKLTRPDSVAGDDFARTVSITTGPAGDFVAVGSAKWDRPGGILDVGRVIMYNRVGANWTTDVLATPVTITSFSEFGTSVSVDGDAVLIGAPFTDDVFMPSGIGNSGSAYVFRRNHAQFQWFQEAKLVADDASELDTFGTTVLLHGDTAFVAAVGDKDPNIHFSNAIGAVYVFRNQGGVWMQVQKLTPSDVTAISPPTGVRGFGRALATDGQSLIVGDRSNAAQSAYVFVYNGTHWAEEAILKKPASSPGSDQFGHAVAIEGDHAFVGAVLDDDNGFSNSGTVFAYQRVGGVWIPQALLYDSMPGANHRFGTSIALAQGRLAVGAIEASGPGPGHVRIISTSAAADCDGDGMSDECQLIADPGLDGNGNGILDACECSADAECNDGIDCTADSCEIASSLCVFTLLPDNCRIGGVCWAAGEAHPTLECQLCDPARSTTSWSAAADDSACAAQEVECYGDGFCLSGVCRIAPLPLGAPCGDPGSSDCDDPDICNGSGACFNNHKPNLLPCTENGVFCDGEERCLGGECLSSGIPPCVLTPGEPICDEELDRCVTCLQDFQCGDSNPCTIDTCDANGDCQHAPAPAGTFCGSALDTICNRRDTCDVTGVCQSNFAPAGTLCGSTTQTDCNLPDSCDGMGGCSSNIQPNGTPCASNGQFCDGMERCENAQCLPSGINPCTTNCDEVKDVCFLCSTSAACDDNNPCTHDTCSPSGLCIHQPAVAGMLCGQDADCDNQRTCSSGQCVGPIAPNGTPCTSDDDACTFDVCRSGRCAHLPAEYLTPCGPDDCNCNQVDDLCDIAQETSQDCNHNDTPDECELPVFTLDTGYLSPIGDFSPQSISTSDLPAAQGEVAITLHASADLFSSSEWIDLTINGQFVHRFFTVMGFDCPVSDDVESIDMPAEDFNLLVPSGALIADFVASPQVRADLCSPQSRVRMTLNYVAPSDQDCNGNTVLDECDLAADPANDCNGNEMLDECEIVPPACHCPAVALAFVSPADGAVDARQPFDLSGAPPQGIDSFLVTLDRHPGIDCWLLSPSALGIPGVPAQAVTHNGDGTYTVTTALPTLPGLNHLAYTDFHGLATEMTVIGHPGNVDGGPQADADDVIAHAVCCLGDPLCGAPYDHFRCDVNHSQGVSGEDLLRVIDLLNGADAFTPWIDTQKP